MSRTVAFENLSTLAWQTLLAVGFLFGFSASAQAGILIEGVQMTVAVDNTVTITNQGTSVFFGDVGTAGNYPVGSGWAVSSGTITWRDNNNNVAATLSSGGVNVPVSGRFANGFKTGAVTLTNSNGAFYRANVGGSHVSTFVDRIAEGSVRYEVAGTVTVLVNNATLLDNVDLDVDSSTNAVTVFWSGDPVAFGNVGEAGTFSLLNGWKVASDSRTWFDGSSNIAATLFAPGLNVPVGGRIATSNTTGSLALSGTTVLGGALKNFFGDGTWAFSSLAAQSPTTDFWVQGVVTIPEPTAGLAGASALLVIALLRAGRGRGAPRHAA